MLTNADDVCTWYTWYRYWYHRERYGFMVSALGYSYNCTCTPQWRGGWEDTGKILVPVQVTYYRYTIYINMQAQ